ncbi:MAG TPA: DUF892 family protein, partial [Gemmatimonadaceae bacterium]|nr:DUF892 family protein [Gemmatimonadaceae bacterium]
QVFDHLGVKPSPKTCKGMEGLIAECEEFAAEKGKGDISTVDAALIAGAQKIEHYEIAGYGTVRTFANILGFPEHADLLQRTLDEEGQTDKRLTTLAETVVNIDAVKE